MSKPEKYILDATAGFRMMWFNKHHPNTIYLDQRPECEPDIVGDFRDLKQFPDETFRLIVFDPPHRKALPPSSSFAQSYGCSLNPETWQSDIQHGITECWRVLRNYGILVFKWSNHCIGTKEVLSLFPIQPLFGQTTTGHSEKYHRTKTFWFCFMKFPSEEEKL